MKKNDANKEALKIEKRKLNSCYKMARNSIMLVIILTLFETSFLFGKIPADFLFSSSLPFYATLGDWGETSDKLDAYFENIELLATSSARFLVVTWVVFVVVICLYSLAWLYSKKEGYKWLAFAFCFYLFDTIAVLCNSGITIIFWCHVIVLALLARGIYAGVKLKNIATQK